MKNVLCCFFYFTVSFETQFADGLIFSQINMTLRYFFILALQSAIDCTKSFIIPVAVFVYHINVEDAVYLARLEQEFQVYGIKFLL